MVKTPDVNAPAADAVPTAVTLTTLFGEREFAWDKAIYFPAGLKGFPDHNVFALASFPGDGSNAFILMQCLTEPELAFIVAPLIWAYHKTHSEMNTELRGLNHQLQGQ